MAVIDFIGVIFLILLLLLAVVLMVVAIITIPLWGATMAKEMWEELRNGR